MNKELLTCENFDDIEEVFLKYDINDYREMSKVLRNIMQVKNAYAAQGPYETWKDTYEDDVLIFLDKTWMQLI